MNNLHQKRFFAWLICLFTTSFLFAQATTQLIGVGQTPNVTVTTSNTQTGTTGKNTLSNEGFKPNNNASSRFLQQASFGANHEAITTLSATGFEDWIDHQFTQNKAFNIVDKVDYWRTTKNTANGNDPNDTGAYPHFWDYAYWEYTMSSDDVLRQRIALALTEILVISENSSFGENSYALGGYFDLMLDNAFNNYRDILGVVTFSPAMGNYLTYMNNPKADPVTNRFPDENYAREVMQLFTIGLCELNIDGTCKTDEVGNPIPTYDNTDIAEFSKIFTGLTWDDPHCPFFCGPRQYEETFKSPMQMNNDYHDEGEKRLLNDYVVQAKTPVDGMADINEALDNLFNHPNVGPFIGKLLIQRLVTSNPSPEYVTRVAQAFNGESHYSTQRGNMQAIIKAILLDDEARSCAAQNAPTFGMLREPFIRYLHLCKAFDLTYTCGIPRNAMASVQSEFGQKPFTSPSVFNFFQQDYQPIGPVEEANLFAPEFQITNAQTIAGYMNQLNEWLINGNVVDDWGDFLNNCDYNNRPSLDFTDENALTYLDKLPELIDRLNLILTHGQLSQASKDAILAMLREMPTNGWNEENSIFLREMRARVAIYLIMASPEYLINK